MLRDEPPERAKNSCRHRSLSSCSSYPKLGPFEGIQPAYSVNTCQPGRMMQPSCRCKVRRQVLKRKIWRVYNFPLHVSAILTCNKMDGKKDGKKDGEKNGIKNEKRMGKKMGRTKTPSKTNGKLDMLVRRLLSLLIRRRRRIMGRYSHSIA